MNEKPIFTARRTFSGIITCTPNTKFYQELYDKTIWLYPEPIPLVKRLVWINRQKICVRMKFILASDHKKDKKDKKDNSFDQEFIGIGQANYNLVRDFNKILGLTDQSIKINDTDIIPHIIEHEGYYLSLTIDSNIT